MSSSQKGISGKLLEGGQSPSINDLISALRHNQAVPPPSARPFEISLLRIGGGRTYQLAAHEQEAPQMRDVERFRREIRSQKRPVGGFARVQSASDAVDVRLRGFEARSSAPTLKHRNGEIKADFVSLAIIICFFLD